MQYTIGIDIGTSSTKAVAFSSTGQILAEANGSYPPVVTSPGYHELDPDLLVAAVTACLREVLGRMAGQTGPSAVVFSAAMHSLIAVDKNGRPLTRAITWADTRSRDIAVRIKPTEAGSRIYSHTGTPIHSMSPLCKIIWLREHEPDIFRAAHKFIGIKEYIWFCFFGKFVIDYSLASATGLFDIVAYGWFGESLSLAGISPERLSDPRPVEYIETAPALSPLADTGLTSGVPFVLGGSDGCLANLGTGAVLAGDASLTIGTSGALRMVTDKPSRDPAQRVFNYILTNGVYVCGGGVNNGGNILQWFVDHFIKDNHLETIDLASALSGAARVKAGSDGLIFLPYLLGERAPIWNEDARGVFFGIGTGHTRFHFLRAVMEGISFSLCQVGLALEETLGPIRQLYASGGFIRSAEWLQMMADIFNKRVCVTHDADASAIGAAMLGFYAIRQVRRLEDLAALVSPQEVYEPDPSRHRIYQESYQRFASLYLALKGEFSLLAGNAPGTSGEV